MVQKLLSRKFLLVIVSILCVAVNRRYGLDLAPEDIRAIVELALGGAGVLGVVDLVQTLKPGDIGGLVQSIREYMAKGKAAQ